MKNKLDFKKGNGLIPAIIQNNKTKRILMLGYMNAQAFDISMKTGFIYFWSRTRNELWLKGGKSGNKMKIVQKLVDCDNDSLLFYVDYEGNGLCHLERESCFNLYESI
jgi:phosphoribosyl-AMP cyclohydrolase